MAKTKAPRTVIYSGGTKTYLDEITDEMKADMEVNNPKLYKILFEKK